MGVKHIFEVLRNKKQETCIMRWYKKAAAVLLAAAMAVSMMTACGTTGGGNGGNGGNNGSKPSTSEGVLLGMPLREKSSLWLIRKTRIR